MVVGTVLSVLGIAVVQGFGERMGSMLSEKAVEYVKKVIQNKEQEIEVEIEVPEDVKIEIEDKFVEYLKGLANPVRIGGVAYFFSERMSKDVLEELEAILTEFKGIEENGIAYEMEDWYISERVVCVNRNSEYMDDVYTDADCMAREFAIMISTEMKSDVIDSYIFY